MAQGKFVKLINKKARKGRKGYPVATIAFYGPTNKVASKLVCSIIKLDGAEPKPMRKWFSDKDIRKSEKTLGEVLVFIQENDVKTVSMIDSIIGCPHEEGIDYPEGESCPECKYWKGRDRFTNEILH
jgi:hypothetical protein